MSELIELYEFRTGDVVYRYTTRGNDLIALGHPWNGIPLERSAITNSQEAARNDIRVTFPLGHAFADQFLGYGPEQVTTLTVRRNRYDDPDDFFVFCVYRIVDCEADEEKVQLVCQTLLNAASKSVGSLVMQKFCPNVVYHRGCNLNKDDFAQVHEVTAIDERCRVVTVPGAAGYADNFFTGGMLKLPNNSLRYISEHIGEKLVLWRPSPEIGNLLSGPEPHDLTLYPGCDGSLKTCDETFDNLENNRGCYWIPDLNPYGGSNVF